MIADTLIKSIVDDLVFTRTYSAYSGAIRDDIQDAYEIQDKVSRYLVENNLRGPICGSKVAVNSKQLLARYNRTEPVSAPLFTDQRYPSPAILSHSDYLTLFIEPEIAAILGKGVEDISSNIDPQTAKNLVHGFAPAFELLDMRQSHFADLTLPAAIAQNVSNVGLVIGKSCIDAHTFEVKSVPAKLTVDGEIVADVIGNAPQDPFDAVAWTLNHLAERRIKLSEGMVILCGTHIAPFQIEQKVRHVNLDMGALGSIDFNIA